MSSIEDVFLEMKDTSELMVDLAYSSLLFNNRTIAEEVYMLEENVDRLNHHIQRHAIEDIAPKNVDLALALIRLATSVEVIADAAREIADVVLRDIEPHPILKMSIMDSDVILSRARVSKRSILANKTLGDVSLATETGMWVIAIRRENTWCFGPDENSKVMAGDLLFVRGPDSGEKTFKLLASGKKKDL